MNATPLRYLATVVNSNVDKLSALDEVPVRLCNYVDVYRNDRITADMAFMSATATPAEIARFGLRVGDVIITKDSEDRTDIAVPAYVSDTAPDIVCGYHLAILRARPALARGDFLFWAIQSKQAREAFSNAAGGVTRFGLTLDGVKSVCLPHSDLMTQRTIADFLDRETARIDLLIEKKQRLVELAEEKRSATITAAVTGQIDPETGERQSLSRRTSEGGGGVKMPPGSEQSRARLIEDNEIPPLPAGWDARRFRFMFRESKERNGVTPVGDMLSVSEYHGVVPKDYEREEQRRTDEDLQTYRVVRPGHLAVNTMWLNHLALGVSDHLGHVSPAYAVYEISPELDARFAHHLFRSQYYLKVYLRYLYGIRPNSFQIKSDDWNSIPVILPPRAIQQAIGDFLDRETALLNTIKKKTLASIGRLKEYRSALITAAVTGQIDVATWRKQGCTERHLDQVGEEISA